MFKRILYLLPVLWLALAPSRAQGQKTVIKSDFLVNADTISRDFTRNAKSAADRYGNYVVVWEDDCNGDDDIYARRFDANGTALAPSFRVNDDASNLRQYNPCVAMNWSGKFVIAWEDQRDGIENIYYQCYDAAGTALGSNLVGNGDAVDWMTQRTPAAAMDGAGGFVLAWVDEQSLYWGIYAQRFDSTGAKLGFEFQVDENPDFENLYQPAVGMDLAGNFVVAWADRRALNKNIYAKMYDSTGTQRGADFQANSEVLNDQAYPEVGMCESGSFAIVWMDTRNVGDFDIFARLFNSAGTPQGVDFQVSAATTTNEIEQSVAFDSTGKFIIAWVGGLSNDTYVRRYSPTGTALGAQFVLNHGITSASTHQPTIAMGRQGNFNLVFDVGWENYHIMAQRYDSSATLQGSIYRIDDNMGHSFQITPSVAMDHNGRFAVAWSDSNSSFSDATVYFQQFDAAGSQAGGNIKPLTYSLDQSYPAVAAGGGVTTLFWSQTRNTGYRIMARRYDDSGTPLDTVLFVGDTIPIGHKKKPAVAAGGNGRVAAAWEDSRDQTASDTFNIYFQLIDSSGSLLGANIRVNDDVTLQHQMNPSMAAAHDGTFFMVWQDRRSGNYDIYAQRYDSTGNALGANFKVNDNSGTTLQIMPSVACDSAGNAVVAWQDGRSSSYYDIYAQRYDASGAAVGANFKVNDDIGSAYQWNPAVACAPTAGRFVICWTDYRNPDGDPEVMAQSYLSGSAAGANFQVTDDDNFPYHHQTTARTNVAANDDRVAFAWTDNRRHKGYDIYSRLTDWSFNTTVVQLPTPVLLAPADNSWLASDTAFCTWSAGSKKTKGSPVYYVLKAYSLPDTINPVLVDTTSLTADTLTVGAEARYAWRVEARDDALSLPGISGLRRFGYDKTPPSTIAQISPADSLTTNQDSITFCWHPSTDAVSGIREYALVYAHDVGFSTGVAETTLIDTSITLVLPDTAYYWMVEARDSVGNVGVSYVWHLNVDTHDPDIPTLALPIGWTGDTTVVFSWSEVTKKIKGSAVEYVIQIDTITAFTAPVIEDTTSSLSDTFNLMERQYYWRVMAYDLAGNYGTYSGYMSFGVDTTAPDIQYVMDLPDDASVPYGPYEVSSKVYDLSLKSAWLFTQVNGGSWDSTAMFSALDSLRDTIPALSPATDETLTVSYYVKAWDMPDHQSVSSTYSFKAIGPLGVEGNPPSALPTVYALTGAYPNPSRGQTVIKYQLPKACNVSLTVYNVAGQTVKRFDIGTKPAGYHAVNWNGNQMAAGVYIFRLQAGEFSATKKLLIVK